MSKNYQKAARGWLYALAVVIAGTCFGASPAQSATCFLPSGECSTGKIGPGPGPTPTQEYCNGYSITEKEYNSKYSNTSCFECTSCTKTSGGTFYDCKTIDNTTWDDKNSVCCTNDTKYDAEDGKCCAGGKCDHPCSGGQSWSPTLKDCVCPSNVETDSNGNCCASGQVLENGVCTTPCKMNDCSDYPYTSDPGNSEKCEIGCNKGTRYKCKSGYTYSNGSCIVPATPTPTPQCTNVDAAQNTDRIIKSFNVILATKQENVQNASLECGTPFQSYQSGFNQTYSNRFMLENPILGPVYGRHSDGKYYVKNSTCGGGCFENVVCSSLAGEGYVDWISGTTGEYCCKQNVFSTGGSTYDLSELKDTNKCKPRPSYNPNTPCDGPSHHQPYYVCTKGTLSGTKCYSDPTYTCPENYKLIGTNDCISTKAECPEGYKLEGSYEYQYSCIKNTYTCPTNFEYTLSGNKCLCKNSSACSDYTLTSEKDSNCYSCTPCPYDSSKYKCTESVSSNYQLVNGVCSKKPAENCSKYSVSPWVVNGPDNSVKCRAINSSYVPCGEQATCGGTQYVECKDNSKCGNGGGSTGNSCTASTYTASVTCKLSYSTDECCNAFTCSGKGCGTGYYECVFDVPSCAFSSVSIHATDSTGQDKIVASAGAGQTTRVLNNYQIPGLNTPCEFFASSSSLGKVKGEAVSGQSYTWKCSYTKKK